MNFKANIPIYLQVIQDIKRRIISGEIKYGDKLPSSRELAIQYQINPNTAARVYNEMELEGLSFTRRGIGTFVTEEPIGDKLRKEITDELIAEFDSSISGLGYSSDEIINMIKDYYNQ
ncbi:MAG: GntR family transcriptional regulator [Wujia sp.]